METVKQLAANAKIAAYEMLSASTEKKNAALKELQARLLNAKEELKAANASDVVSAKERGKNAAFLDRLQLTDARIEGMAKGLDDVIALPDPVNEIAEEYDRPSGIHIKKIRSPLGVVAIIFEARPNVAIEAAALTVKSGNAVLLKGSRDSANSVEKLVELIRESLKAVGLNPDTVCNVGGGREEAMLLLKEKDSVDVVIPRGGNGLKKAVSENATMPVIASAGGNCHMYLAESAPLDMAVELVLNAKTQRPSVCNALETVLFDRKLSKEYISTVLDALKSAGVILKGDEDLRSVYPDMEDADDAEFFVEYENLIIKAKRVADVQEAVKHINRYGTGHSDAILTGNDEEWEIFWQGVDSAAVYRNASTRFTDGNEFGLGAEMGISTQKLHVRGPIGLKELTSVRYVVSGNGTPRK